jgi:hypothetical protein
MLTGKLARHCSECRTAAARWTVHHKSARDMERSIVRQEQTWAWRGSPGPQRRWTVHHKSARDMERSIVRQEQTWAWRGSPGPQRAPARKPAGPSQPAGPVRKVLVCL